MLDDKIGNELGQKAGQQDIAGKVADHLKERGYQIANSEGVRSDEPDPNVIGILRDKESKRKWYLFKEKQRAYFLGILWLYNKAMQIEPDKNWHLELYGDNRTLRTSLEELAEKHSVALVIEIHPTTEYERYKSDYKF